VLALRSYQLSIKRTALIWVMTLVWPMAVWSQTLPPATQVAEQIQIGWNLGNTMEAICNENAWGNPMRRGWPESNKCTHSGRARS
jgi:endoglucanase